MFNYNQHHSQRLVKRLSIMTSFMSLLLLTSPVTKGQALDFTAAPCPISSSISVTVTGPGAGGPYTYNLTGCGASINQPGQPANYTFTGLPQHACFTSITVTDNGGTSVTRSVYMPNIIFPGVARVYTYPCGPGNFVVIPVGGFNTGSDPQYTLYAADGVTIVTGPQSSNVFATVSGNAGDNFVVGIRRSCGGESFAPVTLATSTLINGGVRCVCIVGPQACSIIGEADLIPGTVYTWTSPDGTVYSGRNIVVAGEASNNGVWQLSATITTPGCVYTLTSSSTVSNCLSDHLPVKFNYVRASSSNCKLTAQWGTATEENIDRYEVEISSSGNTDWRKVAVTMPAVSFSTDRQYSVDLPWEWDNTSVVYFRIKQVDKDGRFTHSTVVKADLSCDGKGGKLLVTPNPVQQNATVTLKIESSAARGKSYVVVTDVVGRQYLNKTVTINRSLNRYELSIVDLPKGTYFVKIISGEGSWQSNTVKILVQ